MTSPTKFYHEIQIILYVCSCDQSLITVAFLWKKLSQPQFYKDLTRKTAFFEGWSWFKFNNLGLALGTNLKFYTSLSKGLKLKVRKFWGLIPTFVEVTREKLVGGLFAPTPSWTGLMGSFIFCTVSMMYLFCILPCFKWIERFIGTCSCVSLFIPDMENSRTKFAIYLNLFLDWASSFNRSIITTHCVKSYWGTRSKQTIKACPFQKILWKIRHFRRI